MRDGKPMAGAWSRDAAAVHPAEIAGIAWVPTERQPCHAGGRSGRDGFAIPDSRAIVIARARRRCLPTLDVRRRLFQHYTTSGAPLNGFYNIAGRLARAVFRGHQGPSACHADRDQHGPGFNHGRMAVRWHVGAGSWVERQ